MCHVPYHRQGGHACCLHQCFFVFRRIGSDEEQQLLKSAKDDLNIASSKRQGTKLPALMLMQRCLQTYKSYTNSGRACHEARALQRRATTSCMGSALQSTQKICRSKLDVLQVMMLLTQSLQLKCWTICSSIRSKILKKPLAVCPQTGSMSTLWCWLQAVSQCLYGVS